MQCGLYIHIPFCIKKCAYCDFASSSAPSTVHNLYFSALKKEIENYKGILIDSIFIGGGTPSCVDEHYIYDILEYIRRNMTFAEDIEITIEANPGTLTHEKLCAYRACGINRISIGAQAMHDSELAFLGRIHTRAQTIEAVELIKSSGFTNYNLDLMLATPNQTIKSLQDTLKQAVGLSPSHISAYSLIIEEGTAFYELNKAGKLNLPDENTEREMYDYTVSFLKQNGYMQYEISNFAKSGYECKHNLKYWQCMPYVGVGAAAHSYYQGKRYENTSDTDEYIAMINKYKSAKVKEQVLGFDERVSEYIIMAMRLCHGINLNDFFETFGFKFEEKYKLIIDKYTTGGFLECTDTHIRFTHKGISVSNTILCEFV